MLDIIIHTLSLDTCKVKSQKLNEYTDIPFFTLIFTFFPSHETATEAVTTVFEKMYIFYYRNVKNFSMYP
jgi:hypothetical protein